ncbi:DUF1493 family protein [Cronobacter sakazakii]
MLIESARAGRWLYD